MIAHLSTILVVSEAASNSRQFNSNNNSKGVKKSLLLLDVDNTLYMEKYHKIEAQIVANIRRFVMNEAEGKESSAIAAAAASTAGQPLSSLSTTAAAAASVVVVVVVVTADTADDLHRQFGSTVEGLRQTIWKDLSPDQLRAKQRAFYASVYAKNSIDVTSLLMPLITHGPPRDDTSATTNVESAKTGYSHHHATTDTNSVGHGVVGVGVYNVAAQQQAVRRLLKSIAVATTTTTTSAAAAAAELHIASNSPLNHVQRVIQATGLAKVPWTRTWTPDRRGGDSGGWSSAIHNGDYDDDDDGTAAARNTDINAYPTKLNPREFWGSDFLDQEQQHHETVVTLIDDSKTTLDALCDDQGSNLQTIHLSSDGKFPCTLPQALGVAMGWFSSPGSIKDDDDDECDYQFSDVEYLWAKNAVDRASIHRETWMQMSAELTKLLLAEQEQQQKMTTTTATPRSLSIVDVGAGLLSVLTLVLGGFDHDNVDGDRVTAGSRADRLPSLLGTLHQNGVALSEVQYYAYEPNRGLESACVERLESLGFSLQSSHHDGKELVFVRSATTAESNQINVTVRLRFWDFKEQHPFPDTQQQLPSPHLIVGCCFADLFEPYDLVTSLMRCFLTNSTDCSTHALVYFPITFGGVTQFLPPQPFESLPNDDVSSTMIPSDTKALALYSKTLTESHGHNLDPNLIESAMEDYGATCLGRGKSDWMIDPRENDYIWRTMLYFFGTVAAPELQVEGWNARGWLDRARRRQPTIHVSNVDLLFRVPRLGEWSITESTDSSHRDDGTSCQTYDEILFKGPRKVTSTRKDIVAELQPSQIRIETECSLISSGTELKIFKGNFDDAALDVNIKGMGGERMTYPLAYGYSLVGRVVECGSGVEDADQVLGKRVFTFSAHASQVVTDRSAVQLVPDGIVALDAIFLPSVETALSLVQDARPIFGENVAVFGQGLIGLLVTALLRQHAIVSSGCFGTVSTFDTVPDRLAASAAMGASQALFPTESNGSGPFDVAIEVSGNNRALQTAIDSTRRGGRIVIGSWYGNEDISLKLGIDFHRSHKTIKASQVSEIPAELSMTWSKDRRFALTWALVKSLRPSRLVTRRTSLDCAQEAYDALEKGTEIAIAFEFR